MNGSPSSAVCNFQESQRGTGKNRGKAPSHELDFPTMSDLVIEGRKKAFYSARIKIQIRRDKRKNVLSPTKFRFAIIHSAVFSFYGGPTMDGNLLPLAFKIFVT